MHGIVAVVGDASNPAVSVALLCTNNAFSSMPIPPPLRSKKYKAAAVFA
jgi:hypothetical protein